MRSMARLPEIAMKQYSHAIFVARIFVR